MAKIWRNQIRKGNKKFSECPEKYQADVKALLTEDQENGEITKAELKKLLAA